MARINVEDDLLQNPRFQALVRRMGGDLEQALGRLVRFWWAAQKHWCDNKTLLPRDEFELGDFDHLIDVGFAVEKGTGIYARGGEEQFDWLRQKLESASVGGKKSAAIRREKYGTAVPPGATNNPKRDRSSASEESEHQSEAEPNSGRTQPNALTPTPTLTPTPALKDKERDIPPTRADGARETPSPGSEITYESVIDPVDEAMRDDPPGDVTGFACPPPPKRKSPKEPKPPAYTATDMEIAERWRAWALEQMPSLRANLANWADTVRKLREIDKVSSDELERIFQFVRTDDFWRKNAISLDGLRNPGRGGLRKFETIRLQMRETPGKLDDWDEWIAKVDREQAEGRK